MWSCVVSRAQQQQLSQGLTRGEQSLSPDTAPRKLGSLNTEPGSDRNHTLRCFLFSCALSFPPLHGLRAKRSRWRTFSALLCYPAPTPLSQPSHSLRTNARARSSVCACARFSAQGDVSRVSALKHSLYIRFFLASALPWRCYKLEARRWLAAGSSVDHVVAGCIPTSSPKTDATSSRRRLLSLLFFLDFALLGPDLGHTRCTRCW